MIDEVDYLIRKRNVPVFPLRQLASFWCRLLAGYSFSMANVKDAVARSHPPTLFIHGTGDTFVPFSMLDTVYNACPAPKEKAIFPDAVHGESSFKYPARYESLVTEFLKKYL